MLVRHSERVTASCNTALDNRRALGDARDKVHTAFDMANDQFLAGSISSPGLLTTEQSLVAIDAAVASSDGGLIQDQIAVFKALGGGWRGSDERTSYVRGAR
jgi:outer membrane protein, multidrug efflux system